MTRLLTACLSAVARLRRAFRRSALQQDIDDEVAFHLAMREASLAGQDDTDAARAARRQFGNAAVIKEQTQDMWTFPSFESIAQDVRYACRSLLGTPGFSVVAVLALAIGIGANSAIFSLVNAVAFRALPFAEGDRLVVLIGNVQREAVERRGNSWPDHEDWRAQAVSFENMGASSTFNVTLMSAAEPRRLTAEGATSSYFSTLGVSAARGRTFAPEDDRPNGPALAVLSDATWRAQFGADPAIVGRTVTLGTRPFEIIGVMPPGFKGVNDNAEIWLPFPYGWGSLTSRSARGFYSVARLKPGVTIAQAQRELTGVAARLATAYPESNDKRGVEVIGLRQLTFEPVRPAVTALMAAVAFVLLIACANVATLVVARFEKRSREIAIRAALGAGRARLARQLLTESTVLAAAGAACGLALAAAALRLIVAASPVPLPSFAEPSLDAAVVLFTVAVTAVTALVVGAAPAIHARMGALADAVRSSRGTTIAVSRHLRGALVVLEVAFTVVLLAGAALMIRSVANVAAIDPGYRTDGVLTMTVGMPRVAPPAGAPAAASGAAPLAVSIGAVLDAVRAVPGVEQAALSSDVPLGANSQAIFYGAEGDATSGAQRAPRAYVHRVSPGFFDTLGIRLVAGRTFLTSELSPDSTSVIVSEGVARRFWPGQSALDKRVKQGGPSSAGPWYTIVGVVPDLKYRGLPANPTADPDLFFPIFDRGAVGLVIRAAVAPGTLEAAVRRAINATAAGFVIYDVQPLDAMAAVQTVAPRFTAWVLSIFAAAALLLAAIGLYGVMAYLVDQRRREFGIRLALGSRRSGIVTLVLGNGARLAGIGLAIGAAGAIGVARLLASQLVGVTAFDPAAVAPVALLAAVAMCACLVPAWRATRVDPIVALRED